MRDKRRRHPSVPPEELRFNCTPRSTAIEDFTNLGDVTPAATAFPKIPVQEPIVPSHEKVLPYLKAMEASGQFSNFGPLERALRERFAEMLHVKPSQIATCINASIALAGAITVSRALQWLVPSFTFAATPNAVLLSGQLMQFVDICDSGWTLVEESNDGIAAIPVAPFGATPEVARWSASIPVVHDAAASLGAEPNLSGLKSGHTVVFSLHVTKVMGIGEGAVVVFGDADTCEEFRRWTNHGLDDERRAGLQGLNGKFSESAAAFAHAALDDWSVERNQWQEARERAQSIEMKYHQHLTARDGNGINPYWIVRFTSSAQRNKVRSQLATDGIETRLWWNQGCHLMPAFASIPRRDLSVTEAVSATYLGLPFSRRLSDHKMERIDRSLETALETC